MVKKKLQPKRQKHIPERTCIACRRSLPKRELVRVVRTPEGAVVVDELGKKNGRGAYVCRQRECWRQALQGHALNRALRITLKPEEIASLQAYADSLPATLEPSVAATEDTVPVTIREI